MAICLGYMEKTRKVPPDFSLGIVLHQLCSPAIIDKSRVRLKDRVSKFHNTEIIDKITYAAKPLKVSLIDILARVSE